MRLSRGFAALAGIGIVAPALFVGCFAPAENCELAYDCPKSGPGTTSSSSGAGGGAMTDPECVPSTAMKGPVDDMCGVFVAAATGIDSNTGSKGAPVATMGKAIALAQAGAHRIYACAETFTEAVIVPAGVEIYGGLDCMMGWTYTETARTTLTAPADEVPLKLSSGVDKTILENVSVTAVDAAKPGGSSIAVIVDNAVVSLSRCDITAGKGLAGADGTVPSDVPAAGMPGMPGSNTCDAPVGGAGGTITCGADVSTGGLGGNGGDPNVDMGAGQGGLEGEPKNGVTGTGGAGAAQIMGGQCTPGNPGRDGDAGMTGAGGATLGAISINGYAGDDGKDGGTGTPGQGGGGGGGYKSGVFCGSPAMAGPGASGGGGGSGGCGGKGGTGGKAGGSSIGIISLNATITMKTVTITAGAAGNGGAGSVGHSGGTGGAGGLGGMSAGGAGSKPGCDGGKGGLGGDGGSSGGGRGGHSIGIAYTGAAMPMVDGATIAVGAAGTGGPKDPNAISGDGDAGMASNTVEFPAP